MKFVLLFIALNQQPAYLGTYNSQADCKNAIKTIYAQRMTPAGITLPQKTINAIQQAVATQMQYQNEYRCVEQ